MGKACLPVTIHLLVCLSIFVKQGLTMADLELNTLVPNYSNAPAAVFQVLELKRYTTMPGCLVQFHYLKNRTSGHQ